MDENYNPSEDVKPILSVENYLNKKEPETEQNEIPAVYIYIYLKNGNVDKYKVDTEFKAREHAEKIMTSGYRMQVGNRMEWFGAHWIDKICWDIVNQDYLSKKYESR